MNSRQNFGDILNFANSTNSQSQMKTERLAGLCLAGSEPRLAGIALDENKSRPSVLVKNDALIVRPIKMCFVVVEFFKFNDINNYK